MECLTVGYFLCPRCGTVRVVGAGVEALVTLAVVVPKLVERCREFETTIPSIDAGERDAKDVWRAEGIAESIRPPEYRP